MFGIMDLIYNVHFKCNKLKPYVLAVLNVLTFFLHFITEHQHLFQKTVSTLCKKKKSKKHKAFLHLIILQFSFGK